MIPGIIASQEEARLLAELEAVRKANGNDGGSVQVAAEHALDRLARAAATGDKTVAKAYDEVLSTPQGAELYRIVKGHAQVTDAAAALAAVRKIGA